MADLFAGDMSLTPELVTALGITIATLFSSLTALIVAILSNRKAATAAKVAEDTATVNTKKIEEVHVLVNGGLTEQKKEIARLSAIIADLTGAKSDVSHAETTADQAKDSVKLSKDMMDKLPNG